MDNTQRIKRLIVEWENDLGETITLVTHQPIEGQLDLEPVIRGLRPTAGPYGFGSELPSVVGYDIVLTGRLEYAYQGDPQGPLLTVGSSDALREWLLQPEAGETGTSTGGSED